MANAIVPFAEPSYLAGMPSPYFQKTHLEFQKRCRAFLEEHFIPYALEWETAGTVPEHVWTTFNKHNMLLPNLSSPLPVSWLKRLNINDILGVSVEEWDYLHTAIWVDERAQGQAYRRVSHTLSPQSSALVPKL
jgi:acyl-CoA dehydrogenase